MPRIDPKVLELLAQAWERDAEMAEACVPRELPGACRKLRQQHLRTLAKTRRDYAAEMRRLVIPDGEPPEEYLHWAAVLLGDNPA